MPLLIIGEPTQTRQLQASNERFSLSLSSPLVAMSAQIADAVTRTGCYFCHTTIISLVGPHGDGLCRESRASPDRFFWLTTPCACSVLADLDPGTFWPRLAPSTANRHLVSPPFRKKTRIDTPSNHCLLSHTKVPRKRPRWWESSVHCRSDSPVRSERVQHASRSRWINHCPPAHADRKRFPFA